MKSYVSLSLLLLNLKLSTCFAYIILNINTQSNDSFSQNEPQNGMNVVSVNIEANKDLEVKNCSPQKILKLRDDYTLYPGTGYYKYHVQKAMWHNAKYICELEGAHLAIINSQPEADLLTILYNSDPNASNYMFLGFHDIHKEGQFVTIFGEPLQNTGFHKWAGGQPDNYKNNENCGSLTKPGLLNDFPCTAISNYICEKEL